MGVQDDGAGRTQVVVLALPLAGAHSGSEDGPNCVEARLFESLPADCKVFWLVPAGSRRFESVESKARFHPVDFHGLGPSVPIWMQDQFVCLGKESGGDLVVSVHAHVVAKEAALQVALLCGRKLRVVDLHLSGGNLLALGQHLLVGKDLAFANGIPANGPWLAPDQVGWEALTARFMDAFDAESVTWIGTQTQMKPSFSCLCIPKQSWQPLFHLDLFMMSAGVNVHGQPRVFIGELWPMPDDDETNSILGCLRDGLEEILKQVQSSIPAVEIARLPIVAKHSGGQLQIESMCNGWVDSGPMDGKAYLPDFGHPSELRVHSEAMCKTWGLQTIWIDLGFRTLAQDGGALHCAVKVLEKE